MIKITNIDRANEEIIMKKLFSFLSKNYDGYFEIKIFGLKNNSSYPSTIKKLRGKTK